ncbi:hypothetical protein PVAG01_00848 [Phlyctema vagabunda]|uniref:Uncharacterized protein n=1 Tax=Phlyctema vagabunda TaxID=108571 RepID=A0ABR4PVF4_9HELO
MSQTTSSNNNNNKKNNIQRESGRNGRREDKGPSYYNSMRPVRACTVRSSWKPAMVQDDGTNEYSPLSLRRSHRKDSSWVQRAHIEKVKHTPVHYSLLQRQIKPPSPEESVGYCILRTAYSQCACVQPAVRSPEEGWALEESVMVAPNPAKTSDFLRPQAPGRPGWQKKDKMKCWAASTSPVSVCSDFPSTPTGSFDISGAMFKQNTQTCRRGSLDDWQLGHPFDCGWAQRGKFRAWNWYWNRSNKGKSYGEPAHGTSAD